MELYFYTREASKAKQSNQNMPRPETHSDRKAGHGSTKGAPSIPKKGGNGKGNWGAPGDEEDVSPVDPRDPCYAED